MKWDYSEGKGPEVQGWGQFWNLSGELKLPELELDKELIFWSWPNPVSDNITFEHVKSDVIGGLRKFWIKWCYHSSHCVVKYIPFQCSIGFTKVVTRVTLNAEIPLAALISIRAEGWDCETVRTVKLSRYIRGWRSWNNQAREAVLVLVALWLLCGGYAATYAFLWW